MDGDDSNLLTLADAVARNSGMVLSLPSAGMLRNYKSRFLGETETGLWVELEAEAIPHVTELLEKKQPVAVSFKTGTQRLSFVSTGVTLEPHYKMNEQMFVPALLMERPASVKGIQRRTAYRVQVRPESELVVRLWIIPEHAFLQDRPLAGQEIKAEIRDISVGGLGVRIPMNDKTKRLAADQRLRVMLKYQNDELLLDARLRAAPKAAESQTMSVGVAFKKMETDVQSRQKQASLTRIVGELHRAEVRRSRLSRAS